MQKAWKACCVFVNKVLIEFSYVMFSPSAFFLYVCDKKDDKWI